MKKFLHVGCGPQHKNNTTPVFNTDEWEEVRFDIDANVEPDIVGTMTNMGMIPIGSYDAIFSSHNIEHLYEYEVPRALGQFRRVLKPTGFVTIACPDLQSICREVVNGNLTNPVYDSEAGPIRPLDILYGLQIAVASGQEYMAHRCGFTAKVLGKYIKEAGFQSMMILQRPAPYYELQAIATVNKLEKNDLHNLVRSHFPKLMI